MTSPRRLLNRFCGAITGHFVPGAGGNAAVRAAEALGQHSLLAASAPTIQSNGQVSSFTIADNAANVAGAGVAVNVDTKLTCCHWYHGAVVLGHGTVVLGDRERSQCVG